MRAVITWFAVALTLSLVGCASSTAPGAIGVARSQLLTVPSERVNQAAALGYSNLTAKASAAGKLNSDVSITKRVKDISSRLIRHVGTFRPDAVNWPWEVNVIDEDLLNATCRPGGKIVVYTGIVRRLELSDDELASVLGHEISHALREHSREKASQRELSSVVVQAIVAGSNRRNVRLNAELATLGSHLLVELPFSREMESESDLMGLELMARAGYDPRQASNVWRKMSSYAGTGGIEFLNTHPANETRMTQLDGAVSKVLALYSATSSPVVASASTLGPPATAAVHATPTSALGATVNVAAQAAAPTPSRLRIGQDSFNVERLAMSRSCTPGTIAYVTDKGPGYESYTMNCGAVVLAYRCDFGNCRAL